MNPDDVTCPTCFENFTVPLPGIVEVPAEVDYDCEICCRPMIISFETDGEEVFASARGIHD